MQEYEREPKIDVYLPNMGSGGAERNYLRIIPLLQKMGYDVQFVLNERCGSVLDEIPSSIRVSDLQSPKSFRAIRPLIDHIKSRGTDLIFSNMPHANIVAILVKKVFGLHVKVIAVEHNHFSQQFVAQRRRWSYLILPLAYRLLLRHANRVVAVSNGVADDLAVAVRAPADKITVIHNPAVPDNIDQMAAAPRTEIVGFQPGSYVIAIGRLVEQKDYPTLLRAISFTGESLLILGTGHLLGDLKAQCRELGLEKRVRFAGFIANPYPHLAGAKMLVLSSIHEGFGNVIPEALALGVPVVSTDCKSGPAEILEHGRYGRLVPVGDAAALALAILETDRSPIKDGIKARGSEFRASKVVESYAQLIKDTLYSGA